MDIRIAGIAVFAMCSMANGASCKEYPIGQAQEKEGMHIAAVYLQPIEMDPPGMMRDAKEFGCPSRSGYQGGERQSERICRGRLDALPARRL